MTKKYADIFLILLLMIFILQAIPVVLYQSPTFDEPNWVAIAWYLTHYWTWQADYHVLMHPPLFFYLHGLPLRLSEWWCASPATPPEGILAQNFPYPYSAYLNYQSVFSIARFAMLPLSVILGAVIYRWASKLYGKRAGIFAVGLYVCHPSMLAFSTVATPDMPSASMMFLTTYFFWKFCRIPLTRYLLLTGIMLGFALSMRASAVLLFPILFLCGGMVLLMKRRTRTDDQSPQHLAAAVENNAAAATFAPRRMFIRFGICLGIALLILEASYLFDIQPVKSYHPSQSSDMLFRIFKDIPLPFGAYINGIRLHEAILLKTPRTHFFAGTYSEHSWWYHLATFPLKNPLPFVLFLILSAFHWKGRLKRLIVRENFLIVPVLFLLLYFSVFFPLTDISRYLLGIYPFLFVFASRIVTFPIFKQTSARIVAGVLIGWYVLSSLSVFPHYLSYCNELVGGAENGYTWFADSNYDWGQDLKGLGEYMRQNQIPTIKLAYFGTAIPEYYGINYTKLAEPDGCRPTTGLIAMSATTLQGVYAKNQNCYDWLKQYEPIDKIGYSIFIYLIT